MSDLVNVGEMNRSTYIGSSDISGILGISPWATPVTVWHRKVFPDDQPEDTATGKRVKRRGKRMEAAVGEMLVEKLEERGHKVEVLSTNHRYTDPDVPYFAAEIDYEIRLDDIPGVCNVELKTVHHTQARHWGDEDSDDCPVWYAAQAMFGLGIMRRQCCIVAPLFSLDDIRVYPIVADQAIIEGMRQQAMDFWNLFVLPKKAPEPRNLDDLHRLFGVTAETIQYTEPDIVQKLLRFKAIDAEIDAREAERDALEFDIKRFMGHATILQIPDQDTPAATWRTQKSSRLDTDSLKTKLPKVYREFQRESKSRVFRVNKFKMGGYT